MNDIVQTNDLDIFAEETAKEKKARIKIKELEEKKYGFASLQYRYSKKEIAEYIGKSGGLMQNLTLALGCSYAEVYKFFRAFPEFKKLWDDTRNEIVAKAEGVLTNELNSENENIRLAAAKFILERIGGYSGKETCQEIKVDS